MNFNEWGDSLRQDFSIKGIIIFIEGRTVLIAGYPYVVDSPSNDNEVK